MIKTATMTFQNIVTPIALKRRIPKSAKTVSVPSIITRAGTGEKLGSPPTMGRLYIDGVMGGFHIPS